MNPRAEAQARVGPGDEAHVLEPSPPAVAEAPWFADDPVAPDEPRSGRRVVSPVGSGDVRWSELAAGDPELGAWCAERWLGPHRRLGPAPASLAPTRIALHRLAEAVVSPARRAANGKIGLRYTRGGFGTPFFGADVQVRVEGTELVVDEAGNERRAPITSVAAAVTFLGPDVLPPDAAPGPDAADDAPLAVDPAAAAFLGDFYGFAASVLEELRALAGPAAEPSRVQLWPEHFDLAVELGSAEAGARAAYGCSPGDEAHPEPYVYVAPWEDPGAGPLWQASGFRGAELPFAEVLGAADQRETVVRFLAERLRALT